MHGPVSIPVGRRVASLYFLHGCRLEEKNREGLFKRFRQKDSIGGIRLGTYRIRFADQTEDSLELRYGWNVLACRDARRRSALLLRRAGRMGCLAGTTWPSGPIRIRKSRSPRSSFPRPAPRRSPYLLAVTAKLPRPTE